MRARTLLWLLAAVTLVGCRSAQLGTDQSGMRQTLLQLYEAQVVDNLIRAKLSLPVVQVDYSNLTGSVIQNASANVGQTQTKVYNSQAGAVAAFLSRIRTYVFNYSVSAGETANLTMTGQPVINNDAVYDTYVEAIRKHPDLVVQSLTDGATPHLTHRFGGQTWYVPDSRKHEFFKVYLATTVQRQTKVAVVLTFRTTILSVISIRQVSEAGSQLELRLKDKILNDSGELTVPVNGIDRKFAYQWVPDIPPGHPTDRILLNNDESAEPKLKGAELAKAIAGKEAVLKNNTFVPGYVAPPTDQLEPIRSQLELQRLQQLGR